MKVLLENGSMGGDTRLKIFRNLYSHLLQKRFAHLLQQLFSPQENSASTLRMMTKQNHSIVSSAPHPAAALRISFRSSNQGHIWREKTPKTKKTNQKKFRPFTTCQGFSRPAHFCCILPSTGIQNNSWPEAHPWFVRRSLRTSHPSKWNTNTELFRNEMAWQLQWEGQGMVWELFWNTHSNGFPTKCAAGLLPCTARSPTELNQVKLKVTVKNCRKQSPLPHCGRRASNQRDERAELSSKVPFPWVSTDVDITAHFIWTYTYRSGVWFKK